MDIAFRCQECMNVALGIHTTLTLSYVSALGVNSWLESLHKDLDSEPN